MLFSVELMTKEQLRDRFATPTTLLGPAYLLPAKILGRDVAHPVQPAMLATALQMLKLLLEKDGAVVPRMWHSASIPATEERIHKGILSW